MCLRRRIGLRRADARPVMERLRPCLRGAVGELQRDLLRNLVAVGCRPGQVEIVRLVRIHVDRDRLAPCLDEVRRIVFRAIPAAANLTSRGRNGADRERDAGVVDGRPGNGIFRARPRVVGVEVVAVAVETLVVRHLPGWRRDAEGVEVARQVDRRRDRGRSRRGRPQTGLAGRSHHGRRRLGAVFEPRPHAVHAVRHDIVMRKATVRADRDPGLLQPRAEGTIPKVLGRLHHDRGARADAGVHGATEPQPLTGLEVGPHLIGLHLAVHGAGEEVARIDRGGLQIRELLRRQLA